jgi:hypothetical protein
MLFQFKLKPIECVVPSTLDGKPDLSWVDLTDGWFWMNCGGQELFRYTDETLQALAAKGSEVTDKPYVNYFGTRLWHDLVQIFPVILNPIPQSLIQLMEFDIDVDEWRQQIARFFFDDDMEIPPLTEAQIDLATTWLRHRKLDVGHLHNGPRIWFWTDGGTMFIRWDNSELSLNGRPIWTATSGTLTMPLQAFIEEVHSFDRRLINAMAERVQTIVQTGSVAKLHIDIKALVNEQRERATWLSFTSHMVKKMRAISWDETVAAVRYFESLGFAPQACVNQSSRHNPS